MLHILQFLWTHFHQAALANAQMQLKSIKALIFKAFNMNVQSLRKERTLGLKPCVSASLQEKKVIWMAEQIMGTATWTSLADAAEVLKDKAGDECAWGWERGGLFSLFNMSSVGAAVQKKMRKPHS